MDETFNTSFSIVDEDESDATERNFGFIESGDMALEMKSFMQRFGQLDIDEQSIGNEFEIGDYDQRFPHKQPIMHSIKSMGYKIEENKDDQDLGDADLTDNTEEDINDCDITHISRVPRQSP